MTITLTREEAQQVLDALDDMAEFSRFELKDVRALMNTRLAQPEPNIVQDAIVYGTGITKDGKRIDPASIYKETQPEPEPVAWLCWEDKENNLLADTVLSDKACTECFPVYTAPPKKEWVGLTDEELTEMRRKIQEYMPMDYIQYGLTIQNAMEEKLKEKNDLG